MKKIVKVTVTDKAVYVNDTRITSRGSKWGYHYIVDEFRCAPKNVRSRLVERGHNRILDDDYAKEFGI